MSMDQSELVAMPPAEPGRDVAAELRGIVGTEAFGRLLEASKITGEPVLTVLRKAVGTYATLAGHEQAGYVIQLVRSARQFRLDE